MDANVVETKRPPGAPGWLAACFGFIFLSESRESRHLYSETSIPSAPPLEQKPAKPTKPSTDWRELALLDDFTIIKRSGKGGFSEIWLSENVRTKEKVAIKVVQLTNADLEPDEVATLIAEAKLLRTLDCPYIIKCKETVHTSDWLVLVLEYASGGEMLDHIHKIKKYTEADAARLFAQIVSAVSYLHNLNIMHRDIKPENIMFVQPVEQCEAEGRPLRVKLIDLGMALLYDPKKVVTGCVGTPGFVAPEVWNDQPHTFALDIYALGVVLFVMLTGRKPHSGLDIRKMTYCNKPIRDAPGLKDERFLALSSSARELLLSMLADDPRDRPTCLAVLQHAFITAVDSNMDAHREMGAEVRQRMRDLAKIRKLHGLCYAMHAQRGAGTTQQAFLEALDQRRLRLKGDSGSSFDPISTGGVSTGSEGSRFTRSSLCGSYDELVVEGPRSATGGQEGAAGAAGAGAGAGVSGRRSISGAAGAAGAGAGAGVFGRRSISGATKAAAGASDADVDKLALLAALPELNHCKTMPPVRMGGWHPPLSPVASCDPSAYGNLEEATLPKGWSAYPAMYEALLHKDALLEGLAPGAGAAGALPGEPLPPPAQQPAAEAKPEVAAGGAAGSGA